MMLSHQSEAMPMFGADVHVAEQLRAGGCLELLPGCTRTYKTTDKGVRMLQRATP